MAQTVSPSPTPTRPLTLFALALTGVFASACLGALTNAINASISPYYFETILHWHEVQDVWRASLAQGIFEGILFGIFFSLVFTAGVGIITRASCPFGFALRHLLIVVAGALACWLIGGIVAMGLASLSPEFFRRSFRGVPEEFQPMLAYAWVGGSICGVQLGGLVSVVLAVVILRGNWLRVSSARDLP